MTRNEYNDLLAEARMLEALRRTIAEDDTSNEEAYTAFENKLKNAYYAEDLSARGYNHLASIAFYDYEPMDEDEGEGEDEGVQI